MYNKNNFCLSCFPEKFFHDIDFSNTNNFVNLNLKLKYEGDASYPLHQGHVYNYLIGWVEIACNFL